MPILQCTHKSSCSRANCTFWHASPVNKGEVVAKIFPGQCRSGKDCNNATCGFCHPSPCTYTGREEFQEGEEDPLIEEMFAEMDELDLSESDIDSDSDEMGVFLEEDITFEEEEYEDEVFGIINGVGKMYPSMAAFEIAKALSHGLPKLSA